MMTGVRRKRKRKENRERIIARRRRDQVFDKEADQFIFELTGKPVRSKPKS